MTDITTVKQRFGIIGTSELLDRALEVAVRVAPTDLTEMCIRDRPSTDRPARNLYPKLYIVAKLNPATP